MLRPAHTPLTEPFKSGNQAGVKEFEKKLAVAKQIVLTAFKSSTDRSESRNTTAMGTEWHARIFVGGMKAGRAPNKPVGDTELREVFGRFGAIKNIKSGDKC